MGTGEALGGPRASDLGSEPAYNRGGKGRAATRESEGVVVAMPTGTTQPVGAKDPWGNPYQYTNIATVTGLGKLRKDRFLVPINSDFDLFSMGPDGRFASALTAKISQDDIIRGSDGRYFGVASGY